MTVERPSTGERRVEQAPPGMAVALRSATAVTLALALVGLLPGAIGTVAGTAAVAVVVAVPILRVGWLAVRWARERDRRYALAAAGLLVVVLGGAALAVATG